MAVSSRTAPGAGATLLPALLWLAGACALGGCDRAQDNRAGPPAPPTPEAAFTRYCECLKAGDGVAAWNLVSKATRDEREALQRGELARIEAMGPEGRAARLKSLGVPDGVPASLAALAQAAWSRELRRPDSRAVEAGRRVTGVTTDGNVAKAVTMLRGGGEERFVLILEGGAWVLDAPASRALGR